MKKNPRRFSFRNLFTLPGLVLPALALACVATAPAADSPAPAAKFSTPPALDGSGKGWSAAEQQIISNADGKASFQLGYDAENFYARIFVADKSPLANSSPLPQEMLKGGDAVSLYFGNERTNGQRVLFARWQDRDLVWIYRPRTLNKKPYTFASPVGSETFDYVGPLDGARVFSKEVPDGYLVEMALPWESLGISPAARIPFDLQVIFSDPSGTINVGGVWWHAHDGANMTVEDLPTEARLDPGSWGEVALAGVAPPSTGPETQTDAAPKTTSPAAKRNPPEIAASGAEITVDISREGKVSLLILDEKGWIVRELLRSQVCLPGPLTVEWDGRDRYNEPLPPGKYTWKALVFDGVGSRFLGSVGNSGRPPYRTPDGLGSMGGQHGVIKSLGTDGEGVIIAGAIQEGTAAIRKVDPETVAAVWKRSAGNFKGVLALAATNERAVFLLASGRRGSRVVDLVVMDPKNGESRDEMKKRYRVNVPPKQTSDQIGLTLAGDRAVFSVFAENRLGGVDLKTGENLPAIEFPSPRGLYALDDKNILVCSKDKVSKLNLETGEITPFLTGLVDAGAVCLDKAGNAYVSDLGSSQQIKKFSPEGKLLATFGKEGGKPTQMIPYDPLAFDNVTDMVIGPEGNLWLAEVSKIPNRVVKMTTDGQWLEDICGPIAYNTFGPDLDDPSIVYYNMGGDPRFVQTKVNYDAYAKNPRDPNKGWQIAAIHDLGVGADGVTPNELMADVASHAYGHVIVFTGSNGERYFFRMSKSNRTAAISGAGLWIWRSDRWVPVLYLSRKDEDKKEPVLSWQDENGDGLVQEKERFSGLPTKTFSWLDRDLVLDGFEGTLAPASVSESGVPDYRGGEYHPYLTKGATDYREGWTFVSQVVDGAVYYVSNPGPERHLSFWDRAAENRLIKVKDGHTQWVIGAHSARGEHNEFTTASGVAGIVDDMVLAHNVEPANYLAFTTDGFTLGNTIVDETGQRPKVAPNSINIENFTGLFIKDAKTGRRMLFSVVSGDDRILEITGPGELTRSNGESLLASSTPLTNLSQALEILYTNWRGHTVRTARIDARDAEWPEEEEGFSWKKNDVVVGDLRLRREDGKLHVFAAALQKEPFAEGDGLELTFADAEGGHETRILLTGKFGEDGKFIAEGVVEEKGGAQKSQEIEIAVEPRWRHLGWRMEAAIPLEELKGLAVTRQQLVRPIVKNKRTGKMTRVGKAIGKEMPDLPRELRFQATLLSSVDGKRERIPLVPEGPALIEAP